MGRSRRILVDEPLRTGVNPASFTELAAGEPNYTVITNSPIAAHFGFTDMIVWADGLISFDAVTQAQQDFMDARQPGQDIFGFPGDFISVGFTGSYVAPDVLLTEGSFDLTRDGFGEYGFDDAYRGSSIEWGIFNFPIDADFRIIFAEDGFILQPGFANGSRAAFRIGSQSFDSGEGAGTSFIDYVGDYHLFAGDAGNNAIYGSIITDRLDGGGGNDELHGGGGNDFLVGGTGNDTLDGGAGRDTADYAAETSPVVVDISGGWANSAGNGGLDTLQSVENARGGAGNDHLAAGLAPADDILRFDYLYAGDFSHAVPLDLAFDLQADANIALAASIPHATVRAQGTDNVDFYMFTVVAAGATATFDIDATNAIDANLTLYDANGNQIASGNDTAGAADPGSTTTQDTLFSFTFAQAGLYYLAVSSNNFGYVPFYSPYTLNVSLDAVPGSTLEGGAGGDTLDSGRGYDYLDGGTGNDTVSFYSALKAVNANLATGIATGDGTDTLVNVENLTGSAFNDVLTGDANANILRGGAGNDRLDGGAGSDTASYDDATAAVTLSLATPAAQASGGSGSETLIAIENLRGSNFNDKLTGNSGDNVIEGGAGNDLMTGGGGSDTASYANATAGVTVSLATAAAQNTAGAGTDTLSGFANLLGSRFADTLTGNGSANRIDGGAGADSMTGGGGGDSYIVDNVGDTITEAANAGYDTVQSNVTFTLSVNVDALILTGTGGIRGTGNALANAITGNDSANQLFGLDGNDTLDGGLGIDTLTGGAGDDLYMLNDADTVVEAVGGGYDTVRSTVTHILAANVDALVLMGTLAIDGTGNALDNSLTGNSGANVLNGGAGNDTLIGGGGNDTASYAGTTGAVTISLAIAGAQVTGGAGTDTLTGFSNLIGGNAGDFLTGNASANRIDGGAGADRMTGGAGSDIYVVDRTDDVVVELVGGGDDLVLAGASYTLSDNVERLTLTGTAISGTGNGAANTITGNDLANGLFGGGANDTLSGGLGDDMLDGGLGNDAMTGGDGDDLYVVDAGGDSVAELYQQGIDTVRASIDYTLGNDVENLELTGAAGRSGTGNDLSNHITGTGANDILSGGQFGGYGDDMLDGGTGADAMTGGYGDDLYVVDNLGDTTIEGNLQGTDLVQSNIGWTLADNVENLLLTGTGAVGGTGNGGDNVLTGNDAANLLAGNGGDDILRGRGGDDMLRGGAGADTADYADDMAGVRVDLGAGTATGVAIGNDVLESIERAIGGTGNDTLIAGASPQPDVIKPASLHNDSPANAVSLDGLFDLAANGDIADATTVPHATIRGTGAGGYEYYAFTVSADNLTATFDIDGTSGFDSILQLYDSGFSLIGSDDDNGFDPGSPAFVDSRLTYNFAAAGTYYIAVIQYPDLGVPAGETYTLHVSLPQAAEAGSSLQGGDGNDLLIGGVGDDLLFGGVGSDTASFERATGSVVADVATSASGAGSDTFNSIENLTGSAFDDQLFGDAGANVLRGGAGADELHGNAGADLVAGDGGNDSLDGGDGIDLADYSAETAAVTIDLATDTATGSTIGTDTLIAIEGARGGSGNDTLIASSAGDLVEHPDVIVDFENFSLAAAVSLDGLFDQSYDENVEDSVGTPHASALQTEGTDFSYSLPDFSFGSADYYYSFTVTKANSAITIDIDSDASFFQPRSSHDLDTVVQLYDSAGVLIDESDDGGFDTGSNATIDSFLQTVAATPGVYYIKVTSYDGYYNFGQFRLNLSVEDYGTGSRLDGGAGNDTLVSGIGSDVMTGGAGIDTLTYAGVGNAVIVDLGAGIATGHGRDVLSGIETVIGTAFDDDLIGDTGNNLLVGNGGNDYFNGGAGIDTASYAGAAKAVTVNLLTGTVSGALGSNSIVGIENLIGTSQKDTLTGNAGANIINGGIGNIADLLDGGGGIDTVTYVDALARVIVSLSVTAAQNTIGAGVDTLTSFENLTGSAWNDTLTGTADANTIEGGFGNDIITALAGNDTLRGGDGNDTLAGGDGNDIIDGGAGTGDIAVYASAASAVSVSLLVATAQATGGAGSDTLSGIEGLTGSAFNDILIGDANANTMSGGTGNDIIRGDLGNDVIDGGSGIDTLDYSAVGVGITLNLISQSAQNTLGAGTDTVRGIENVIGTAFNDVITGNEFGNIITAGNGDDMLVGGLGNDTLDGGAGIDTANYASATAGVKVNLTILTAQTTVGAGGDTLSGIENLNGTGFDDIFTGDAANNVLTGNGGNDMLLGGLGNDTLSGGQGTDTISYVGATLGVTVNLGLATAQNTVGAGFDTLVSIETVIGSALGDTLTGSNQNNALSGGNGDDLIDGSLGADTIDGGANDDTLVGSTGNDIIIGGTGNDSIDGGANIDTISFAGAGSAVTVSLALTTAQAVGGGQGTDTIVNVENILGSAFGDTLTGSTLANILTGGGGKDVLAGGGGNDIFAFLATSDSTAGANADRIADFNAGDILDLSAIDANANTVGINDAFSRVAAFSNVAGQFTLAFAAGSNTTTLLGDTDGNGVADFSVLFTGDVTALTTGWVL